MEATRKRPWYRLHWGTALTAFFVLVGWVGTVFPSTTTVWAIRWRDPDFFLEYAEGWPMTCIMVDGPTVTDVVALAVDGVFLIACVASVAFVVERLEVAGLRLSISTMLAFVASVAVVFGFLRWNDQLANDLPEAGMPISPRSYVPLDFAYLAWYVAVPFLFAIGCLAYTIFWLVFRAASWPLSRFRRFAPAKVEVNGSPAQ